MTNASCKICENYQDRIAMVNIMHDAIAAVNTATWRLKNLLKWR